MPSSPTRARGQPSRGPDPITAEIIRYGLSSITDQIEKNIMRTAFSPLIYEYRDFSVGILDTQAQVIAQGRGSLPIFVANALGAAVRDGLAIYGAERMFPGDVVINNHAGSMGQHLNNVVMYTPIHVDGALFGFMAILMHWMDVGGSVVGSCFGTRTTDIFQEGIQLRSVKLYSQGDRVEEIYRIIECNTRFPTMVLGDISSQLAGCLMGRDLTLALIQKYGPSDVRAAIELFWAQSEAVARAAIGAVPDGEYRATSFLDDDGITLDRTVPIDIAVRVTGETIEIDFSGIAEQLEGPINAGYNGGAACAARIACKYLFSPGEPGNEGAFRPLTVTIPDGKFLSAGPTAPMGGSGYTLPTVVDTIFKALADAAPDRVNAGHHGTYGTHVFHGRLPGSAELFQHLESCIGGWGASSKADGASPYRSLIHGDMFDTPAEFLEAAYPFRVLSTTLRPDSGGAGRFRGGLGTVKVFEILAPCSLTVYFERSKCAPWGLQGGGEGKPGYVEIHRPGEAPSRILKGEVDLQPGDRVHIVAGGGGGFGSPRDRDPDRVSRDIAHGMITAAAAQRDYGLALADETQ
ncbi:MAG TPA: hydantoinase B/oxoprolinase family protein [Caulobacteraceae bacterium]|nr:hydantoinase B/oxoprolinase family protein [Caulobacteraceae bacterium]